MRKRTISSMFVGGPCKCFSMEKLGLDPTSIAGMVSPRLLHEVHEYMNREFDDSGVDYLRVYQVARQRLIDSQLISIEYMWYTKEESKIEKLIPTFKITNLGEQALEILDSGAFFILRYANMPIVKNTQEQICTCTKS